MSGGGGGGIGSSIGGIVGGIIGGDKASGDRSKGQGYAEQAFNELLGIGLPPDLSKEIIMQKFQEAVIMTQELEQEINLTHSKMADLQESPETRDAQMEALNTFKSLSKTGLGAQDKAALNQVRDQVQRDLEGKRQQILQNMQQRGMGGSGAELITQLQASQGSANQASLEGDRLAAMAQERALGALGKSADLAGNIRGTDYDVMSNKARAADELNRFNVQNQIGTQRQNIGAKNLAQANNLSNKQNIMNKNVAMANEEKDRQNEAQRTYWLDQMNRSKVRSGAYDDAASEYRGRAKRIAGEEQARWTALGSLAEEGTKAAMGAPSTGGNPNAGSLSKQGTLYGGDAYNERKNRFLYEAHGGPLELNGHDVKLPGDTIENDVVDVKMNPGEAVIPKSIMESDDAPENAKLFLKLMMKLKDGKKS
jgi:hypothetical protein